MKNAKTKMILTGIAACFLLAQPVFAAEEQGYTFGEVSEYGYIPVEGMEETKQVDETPSQLRRASLPQAYSLLDEGLLPAVRNQGTTGLCWSFSATASAESGRIKAGLATTSLDLSETYPAWAAYNGSDETYIPALRNNGTSYTWLTGGGNYLLTTAALANWNGAVAESLAPFTTDPATSYTPGLSQLHVENIYYLPEYWSGTSFSDTAVTATKEMVYSQGAVEVAWLAGNSAAYDSATGTYYNHNTSLSANHQVAIVGWDDNKVTAADQPGAWLIRNSYGNWWEDGGYTYISYYDETLGVPTFYQMENTAEGQHVYNQLHSHTAVAMSNSYSMGANRMVGANVYTAQKTQTIEAVGTYLSAGSTYEISVYTGLVKNQDGSVDFSGKEVSATTTGSVTYAGYYTLPLNQSVLVAQGYNFAVVLKASRGGYTYQWFEGQSRASGYGYAGIRTQVETGESFISRDNGSTWSDVCNLYSSSSSYHSNLFIFAMGNTADAVGEGWYQDGANKYYKLADGTNATGWMEISGNWYYFDPAKQGLMLTGWQKIDNKWYYLGQAGDGARQTGWQKVSNKWFYMDEAGVVQIGWQKINNKWFYLGSDPNSGALKIGWQKINNKWFYLGSDPNSGALKIGWQKISGKWYYLGSDPNSGAMKIGWQLINNKWYYLGSDPDGGAMRIGWQKVGGSWYYLGSSADDGVMKTGWQQVGGRWYYMYSNGKMAENTWIGNRYVNSSGVWTRSR